MSIINRLSLEEIVDRMELVKKDEFGNELYEFCDKINFIDINKDDYPPHYKYPEFYINYYLICYKDPTNIDSLGMIVYYRDGDTTIGIYETYDHSMESINQDIIDEIYDGITELFDVIRRFIRLNKRNINIGYALSTYIAAITSEITDRFEHFDDEYRKKVDKWLNG
jgi:hypothetical protein